MIATLKTSGVANAPGTASWASASFTPAAGALILVIVFARGAALQGNFAANLTVSDGTNTYTPRVTQGNAPDFAMQGRCWTAPEAAGASRTITMDSGSNDVSCAMWFIYELTDYNVATPTGGKASAALSTPPDGAINMTLDATPLSSSVVISAYGVDGDSSGTIAVTPGAGWSEDGEVGNVTIAAYAQSQQRTSSTSTSVDWVDVRAGTMATFSGVGVALEVLASTAAPAPIAWLTA